MSKFIKIYAINVFRKKEYITYINSDEITSIEPHESGGTRVLTADMTSGYFTKEPAEDLVKRIHSGNYLDDRYDQGPRK